jgi:hypothetical protein
MALVSSILRGGTNSHETTSEEANAIATDFIGEGIVSTVGNTSGVAPATGGFAVNAQGTPDMTVAVSAGVAYVTGTPSSQNSQQFRVKNSASANVTISANSSGSTKYDWIYISLDATKLNNPNTAGDDVATLVASRSSSASTDDGTPPTYGYALAVVTVANGASAISNSMIRDIRTQCGVSAGATTASSTWTDTGYAPGTITYNGNRSYNLTVANADLTGFLSNGMRVKLTRTTAPPTQCTDLEASSSQYWNKTSPAGTTFTDDFCAGAWIKLESYGSAMGIVSRYNGTSGWIFRLNASGQVQMDGFNGGAANVSQVISYQSIPLGKWVHVAAQLDMSAFTATTTTSYIMIDGVNVPAAVSRAGTNPTALVQAGNLEVGSYNAGQFFDGKIAQVWYSSAKITQATIQTFISQGMTGSETSIVSLFKFDGDGNDSNANANNLTAQAGATATTVDSPFNATEYGIITANAFSTNTTLTVQVPEGYAIPTSGGVSAMAYSTQDVPYGFPRDKGRWELESWLMSDQATTSNATYGAFMSGGFALTVPIGVWNVGHKGGSYRNSSTTTVVFNLSDTALTGLDSAAGGRVSRLAVAVKSAAAADYSTAGNISQNKRVTAQATFVMYTQGTTTSGHIQGDSSPTKIFAEFNYV